MGVHVGMPATKAQVLVPGLVLQDADTDGDCRALDRLALWALRRYAPIVATDQPDGIVIDSTGADHLHGGEQAMLADLLDRLEASGINARGAIADTWGAAHALARFVARPSFIAPVGEAVAAMHDLPLAALRIPADTIAGLHALGFLSVSDLLAQARPSLAIRFGSELGRRIDQALGPASELIVPLRSPELIEVRQAFAEPISAAETIARYVGKLVVALCEALTERGVGARRLDLVCYRVDSRAEAVRVGTASPVRDAKRLNRLLVEKIEKIDPGFGIETMTLAASIAEPLAELQAATSLVDEIVPDVSDLIDVLANRVGSKRLYRSVPVASDVPERSICRVAPMAPDTGAAWPGHWPRPTRLLGTPEPIETMALLPDHPPVSFAWRGIRRRVRRADGPERVFGEWWKRDAELAAVRDYFRVEDDAGERYWIFRAGDGEDAGTGSHRWFLHGTFG
jgi:protein ImuB